MADTSNATLFMGYIEFCTIDSTGRFYVLMTFVITELLYTYKGMKQKTHFPLSTLILFWYRCSFIRYWKSKEF